MTPIPRVAIGSSSSGGNRSTSQINRLRGKTTRPASSRVGEIARPCRRPSPAAVRCSILHHPNQWLGAPPETHGERRGEYEGQRSETRLYPFINTGFCALDYCFRATMAEWGNPKLRLKMEQNLARVNSRITAHILAQARSAVNKSEVILEVGAEGGSITLYGVRGPDGWRFRVGARSDAFAAARRVRRTRDSKRF
jgi:hypothetical protein